MVDIDCEMVRDEINLGQYENAVLLLEVSDEALEAACFVLLWRSPTLVFGSYCFTCRPHLHPGRLSTSPVELQ
jgi:hypothetical protein